MVQLSPGKIMLLEVVRNREIGNLTRLLVIELMKNKKE
jgi:hypothetical protein